jgi:acyl-CoA dehydrogenase family protein 9
VEASGQERHIARSFCKRAERRVHSQLDQIEHNDDEHIQTIAKLAYRRGAYGYALCGD